jgi:hypothetical protein
VGALFLLALLVISCAPAENGNEGLYENGNAPLEEEAMGDDEEPTGMEEAQLV